ncbi:unnamed protein product [Polarella glacialis]|uniref:Tc1-like transposase DDE domain-containing protein n=1 Tax=Polarella glacialis TaxID=89957 RepID=A0A813KE38_POLGL|nr:unnamed protein product [Polarella glacialis]
MAVSPLQRAKRAFVIVLQSIAAAYSVQLDVTRESADNLVHPDKGGKLVDSQRLLAARQLWEDALRAAGANGRPVSGKSSATSSSQFSLSWAAVVHPLSLNFENQRKVILLRDVKKQSWDDVRKQVRNLKGKKPTVKLLRRVYKNFSKKKGRVVYKYKKCGRKPWKVTKGVESFLLRRLKALRCESICTTTVLQRELVNEKGVDLEASTIPLSVRSSRSAQGALVSLSLDGVVLSMAPKDPLERQNWCAHGDTHMRRKRCEAASPDLAGNDAYGKQVPLCRAVPLWAGISEGGFATVVFRKSKKLCTVEWAEIVNGGKLTNAIRSLSPTKPRGPWWVLCDNETFLRTQVSQAAHKAQGISLWSVPPRSPDLNPVEKFWAWLRRTLRQKDWADLRAGRKALDKKAYQARVRSTCRTKRAQAVAASCAGGLRKVCKEAVAKKGAMAVSPLQRAKRAFVIVLQSIAAAYSVQLDVTRESADNLVTSAFRRVAKKVHPDKGGKLVDSQRLLAARQLWEDALRAASANGRPVSGKSSATSSSQFSLSWAAVAVNLVQSSGPGHKRFRWQAFSSAAAVPQTSVISEGGAPAVPQSRTSKGILYFFLWIDVKKKTVDEFASKCGNLKGKKAHSEAAAAASLQELLQERARLWKIQKCGRSRKAPKVLTRNGYFWLTRAQKRKYSPDVTAQRLPFAKAVLRMSKAQLRAASPDLAGNDAYGKQVPLCRAVPLWAGISEGGFATVVFRKSKKLCTVEWAEIVNGGKLTNAIRSLSPTKPRGPWWVLCDNETFLRTQVSQAAHKAQGISLWSVPPRSPDLNPVEKFWAWLRRTLRQKDWADLRAGRKALDKKAYQARVRSTCRTKRAQAVAASCAGGLRKVCKEVVAKKGAMARS